MLESLTPFLFCWMFIGFFVFHWVVIAVNICSSKDSLCHRPGEHASKELVVIAFAVTTWPILLYLYCKVPEIN